MPLSDAQRAEFERRLQSALGRAWGGMADELQRLLGDPPDPARVPAEFWLAVDSAALTALEPLITEMARASAESLAEKSAGDLTINWALVNQRAEAWAAQYTFSLVKNITARSQQELQRLLSNFFKSPEQDLQALAAEIAKLFGPVRGETIAISEVTRAAAEGEGVLIAEIRLDNPDALIAEFWQTSRDEIVCKAICIPLNGVRGDGHGNFKHPKTGVIYRFPAHPRCRCGRRTQILTPRR